MGSIDSDILVIESANVSIPMASLAILPRRTHRLVVSLGLSYIFPKGIADFIPAISTRSFQTAADSAQPTETQTASGPFTIRLHDDTFRGYKTETPSLDVEVNKEMLIDMYRKMTLVRRMEMAADVLYGQNLIRGYCHLSIGQVRTFPFILRFVYPKP